MEEGIKEVTEIKLPDFTRGETLVGITATPDENIEVATAKRACAYLIDVLDKYLLDNVASENKDAIENTIAEISTTSEKITNTLKNEIRKEASNY